MQLVHFICGHSVLTARKLAQAIGTITSLRQALGDIVLLRTRASQILIASQVTNNCDIRLNLNDLVKQEWEFWKGNLVALNGMPLLHYGHVDTVIYSDASATGCAATFLIQQQKHVVHKVFSPLEVPKSSTYRELMAVLHGLRQASLLLQGRALLWKTDSKNIVSITKRGSMKPELLAMAMEIYNLCRDNAICLNMTWIPHNRNQHADDLSRVLDPDDWSVAPFWYRHICHKFSFSPDIDRFASYDNAQTHRFNSKFYQDNAEAVDAFTQSWGNDKNWLVPPIYNIPRVLHCLTQHPCHAILVVPIWESGAFWPKLLQFLRQCECYIVDTLQLGNIFQRGISQNSIFGSKHWKSGTLAILISQQAITDHRTHVSANAQFKSLFHSNRTQVATCGLNASNHNIT